MHIARSAFVLLFFSAVSLEAQQFGASAAIHDGEIFIGEPVNQAGPASVHIYRREGGDWREAGLLKAPDHEGGDYFGRFIISDGETLIVSGTLMDESTGTVWVFGKDGDDWQAIQTIRPEGLTPGAAFGRTGLLHDDLLFITGLGDDDGRGAVWVYGRGEDGSWIVENKLVPGEAASPMEFFGWSLAFNGERLLVGALQPSQELQQRGAAYIFSMNGSGDWTLEQRLTLGEEASRPGDGFGSAVAWLGDQAVIGIPGRGRGAGEVRTYRQDDGRWVDSDKLNNPDETSGALFGAILVSKQDEMWVSSPGANGRGRIYRATYDGAAGQFSMVGELSGLDEDIGDQFGSAVAVSGTLAVVGATGDDFGLGSAVVLELEGGQWNAMAKLLGPEPPSLAPLVSGDISCENGEADQFTCNHVDIASFLPVSGIGGGRGAETNDVWGWTDSTSGHEYAIVGRTDGTSFIDITDPENPIYLGNLPKTEGVRGNSWRDIKVYANHAFVVADGAGNHGMQVFDLTRLRNITDAPALFSEDAHYDGIASAHNIVINEATGFAYAVGANSGGETCGGAFHMIDIRNPTEPTFAGCFADTTTGNSGTGYSHDAMCIVYNGPDADYAGREICFGSNENALSIADVSDKENPVQISSATYPNVAYAHQGWITEDHAYFFMNDEGDESSSIQSGEPMQGTRTLIWDIQDLDDPIMVKEHFGETFTIDHNLYIKGDLMYQSNYVSGLRILDISDRENPEEVGFFDTVPWSEEVEFDGSWSNYPFFDSGTIVVSSGKEGVFFLQYRPVEIIP